MFCLFGFGLHCFAWGSKNLLHDRSYEIQPLTTLTMNWREWKVALVSFDNYIN